MGTTDVEPSEGDSPQPDDLTQELPVWDPPADPTAERPLAARPPEPPAWPAP